MYLLGLNPEKQEKLFEEVKNIMPDNNIVTASDVQKMPYLRACLKESSRYVSIFLYLSYDASIKIQKCTIRIGLTYNSTLMSDIHTMPKCNENLVCIHKGMIVHGYIITRMSSYIHTLVGFEVPKKKQYSTFGACTKLVYYAFRL